MFYKDKKVLVAGGTGFVGTNFVEELVRQGARVRVPVHRRPLRVKSELIETVEADLSRVEDCERVCKGMQYVVHCGGAVSAAAVTNSNPMAVITINLVVTSQMLQAAWSQGVERFMLPGSTTVYPAAERPIKEEEIWTGPTYPTYFAYGWMRRYLERMAEFVAEKSLMKIALLRPTAVYGRHDDFDPVRSHVIPALIRKAAEGMNPYEVWGTGDEVRDFFHISDMVSGCLLALEKHATCEAINLGYGRGFTIKDVVQTILKESGHDKAKVVFNSSKPTTIPFRVVDITKARTVLGWEPKVTLEAGLADTIKWYRENPELAKGGH
jgi:GDP-L-fucose synthase